MLYMLRAFRQTRLFAFSALKHECVRMRTRITVQVPMLLEHRMVHNLSRKVQILLYVCTDEHHWLDLLVDAA